MKHWIDAEAMCIESNIIWTSALQYNALCNLNIETKENHFIALFPNEDLYEWRLHCKAIKVDNEIYFIPDRSKHLHVYNVQSNSIDSYSMNAEEGARFSNGIKYKDAIYIIQRLPKISFHKVNLVTKEIMEISLQWDNITASVAREVIQKDQYIYMASTQQNRIIRFDTVLECIDMFEVAGRNEGFGTICFGGKYFWLTNRHEIVRWEEESGETESFTEFPEDYGMDIRNRAFEIQHVQGFSNADSENEYPFSYSVCLDGKIWLFACRVNMNIIFDCEDKIMKEFKLTGEEETEETLFAHNRITHCHYLGGVSNGKLLFLSTVTHKLYVIDEKQDLSQYELHINIFKYKEIYDGQVDNLFIVENSNTDLKDLLCWI